MDSCYRGHKLYRDSLTCISVVGLSTIEIQVKFKLSKTTAWRASKRGFFLLAYGDKINQNSKKRIKVENRIGEYIYALTPNLYFYIFNLNVTESMRDYLLDYFTVRKYDLHILKNPIGYVNWIVKRKLKNGS